jgi:hypothetical protein
MHLQTHQTFPHRSGESFKHERPEVRTPDWRWHEIIPCRGFKPSPQQEGPFIGLYSENPPTLQLYSDRPINAKSIWKEIRKHPGCSADFGMDGEVFLVHKGKKKSRFSPRQFRFLELYFSGYTLKDSAKGAGYQGSSDQALCNAGGALLRRAVATDAGIAQLFLDKMLRNQSESGRLKGLNILVKNMFFRR